MTATAVARCYCCGREGVDGFHTARAAGYEPRILCDDRRACRQRAFTPDPDRTTGGTTP